MSLGRLCQGQLAVDAQAPALPALPERYVVRPQATPLPPLAWWEVVLSKLPGFH